MKKIISLSVVMIIAFAGISWTHKSIPKATSENVGMAAITGTQLAISGDIGDTISLSLAVALENDDNSL